MGEQTLAQNTHALTGNGAKKRKKQIFKIKSHSQ